MITAVALAPAPTPQVLLARVLRHNGWLAEDPQQGSAVAAAPAATVTTSDDETLRGHIRDLQPGARSGAGERAPPQLTPATLPLFDAPLLLGIKGVRYDRVGAAAFALVANPQSSPAVLEAASRLSLLVLCAASSASGRTKRFHALRARHEAAIAASVPLQVTLHHSQLFLAAAEAAVARALGMPVSATRLPSFVTDLVRCAGLCAEHETEGIAKFVGSMPLRDLATRTSSVRTAHFEAAAAVAARLLAEPRPFANACAAAESVVDSAVLSAGPMVTVEGISAWFTVAQFLCAPEAGLLRLLREHGDFAAGITRRVLAAVESGRASIVTLVCLGLVSPALGLTAVEQMSAKSDRELTAHGVATRLFMPPAPDNTRPHPATLKMLLATVVHAARQHQPRDALDGRLAEARFFTCTAEAAGGDGNSANPNANPNANANANASSNSSPCAPHLPFAPYPPPLCAMLLDGLLDGLLHANIFMQGLLPPFRGLLPCSAVAGALLDDPRFVLGLRVSPALCARATEALAAVTSLLWREACSSRSAAAEAKIAVYAAPALVVALSLLRDAIGSGGLDPSMLVTACDIVADLIAITAPLPASAASAGGGGRKPEHPSKAAVAVLKAALRALVRHQHSLAPPGADDGVDARPLPSWLADATRRHVDPATGPAAMGIGSAAVSSAVRRFSMRLAAPLLAMAERAVMAEAIGEVEVLTVVAPAALAAIQCRASGTLQTLGHDALTAPILQRKLAGLLIVPTYAAVYAPRGASAVGMARPSAAAVAYFAAHLRPVLQALERAQPGQLGALLVAADAQTSPDAARLRRYLDRAVDAAAREGTPAVAAAQRPLVVATTVVRLTANLAVLHQTTTAPAAQQQQQQGQQQQEQEVAVLRAAVAGTSALAGALLLVQSVYDRAVELTALGAGRTQAGEALRQSYLHALLFALQCEDPRVLGRVCASWEVLIGDHLGRAGGAAAPLGPNPTRRELERFLAARQAPSEQAAWISKIDRMIAAMQSPSLKMPLTQWWLGLAAVAQRAKL